MEADAAFIYRNLDDPRVTAGIANSTFVTDFGHNPGDVAIYIKPMCLVDDKPYINLIVGRTEDRDNAVFQRIVAAFQSEEVRRLILERPPMRGVALPGW